MQYRLNWGMIGGGEASQIGIVHRQAAARTERFRFVAGAFDVDPARSVAFGRGLGLDPARVYGDWRDCLQAESARSDRLHGVTIATPNSTHCEIATAFLEHGFHVFCEKPLAVTLADAEALTALAQRRGLLLAVNFCYSGYPMIRQLRAMLKGGELGSLRLIHAEFAHGYHASEASGPRVRWRYDPAEVGDSAVLADVGIHGLQLIDFISGAEVKSVNADLITCVADRLLEDDALLSMRLSDGSTARLWASAVAIGQRHGLSVRVFGSKGGVSWLQEDPNRLYYAPIDGPTTILERGGDYLHADAHRASSVVMGHPEGFIGAVATLYRDLYDALKAHQSGRTDVALDLLPQGREGMATLRVVAAALRSHAKGGWVMIE